jgi:HAMP domain-containing protein
MALRVDQELRRHLSPPHQINRLNGAALAEGKLDPVAGTGGEAQLYQQMKIAPNVAFTGCSSARQGEFLGVLRAPQDGALHLLVSNQGTGFRFRHYYLDLNGNRSSFIRQDPPVFDARQRPWYKTALQASRPAWTDVYSIFVTGAPNITASLPVYSSATQQLVGVCATGVVLPEELRKFLQGLEIGAGGLAFVVDRQGRLMSSSTTEPLLVGEGAAAQSVMAAASSDALLRSAAQALGDLAALQNSQRLTFAHDQAPHLMQVVPFQDGFGLDWRIVVVAPAADGLGPALAHRNTLLGLVLAGAAGSALLVWGLSRWIAKPLGQMAAVAEQGVAGDAPGSVVPTAIAEIDRATAAFNALTAHQQAALGDLRSSLGMLEQQQAKTDALLNAMPDLLLRAKRNGTYLDILGGEEFPVYKPAAFAKGSKVFGTLPPEVADQRMVYIYKALDTKRPQRYVQSLDVDGRVRHEEVRIVPLAEEDEVLIIVRDITDQLPAESASEGPP